MTRSYAVKRFTSGQTAYLWESALGEDADGMLAMAESGNVELLPKLTSVDRSFHKHHLQR